LNLFEIEEFSRIAVTSDNDVSAIRQSFEF